MSKTMCKIDKKEKKKIAEKEQKYECKSCGRTAHKEKRLCKPKKI